MGRFIGGDMRRLRHVGMAACWVGLMALVMSSQAMARQWRSTPAAKAMDYAHIIDRKSANRISLIFWMVPEIVELTPRTMEARQMLRRYAVIGVSDVAVSDLGEFLALSAPPPSIKIKNLVPLPPLKNDTLPPNVVSTIQLLGDASSKVLGKLGQGITWYVFDGQEISSCQEGRFEVSFAGVDYLYETPIPGCEWES